MQLRVKLLGSAAVSLLSSTFLTPQAWGACATGVISSAVTSKCTLGTGDALSLTNSGSIAISTAVQPAVEISSLASDVTLSNSGVISGINNPLSILGGTTNVSITNELDGQILGAENGEVVRFTGSDTNLTFTNLGLIQGNVTDVSSKIGVWIQSDWSATVDNSGTIQTSVTQSSGSVHDVGGVELFSSSFSGALDNSGYD